MRTSQLLQRYPLKVYYPQGGQRHLLHWWTDSNRGHVALTRTQEQMATIVKAILDEHEEVEVRQYDLVTLVKPTPLIEHTYAKARFHDDVTNFWHQCVGMFHRYHELKRSSIGPFRICTQYVSKDKSNEKDPGASNHYDCVNCEEGIVLAPGVTKQKLFETYADAYRKEEVSLHGSRSSFRATNRAAPTPAESSADAAPDGAKVMCAMADFGHHSSGVYLCPAISFRDLKPCLPSSYQPVLFFYTFIRDNDIRWIQEARRVAEAKRRKLKKQQTERYRAERVQADRKLITFVLDVFGNVD